MKSIKSHNKKLNRKRYLAVLSILVLLVFYIPANVVPVHAEDYIASWDAETDGDMVVLTMKAHNKQDWGYSMSYGDYPIVLTADGANLSLTMAWDASFLKGPYWTDIPGSSITRLDEADGQTVVIRIPISYLGDPTSLSVSFHNENKTVFENTGDTENTEATEEPATEDLTEDSSTEAASEDTSTESTTEASSTESSTEATTELQDASTEASSEESEATTEATAENLTALADQIVIDGEFADWANIAKTDFKGTDTGYNGVVSSAFIFDGDVYIYLQDVNGNGDAAWSGPNSNGKYSIVTDLGYTMFFKLNNDGSNSGVEGVESARNGKEWEIHIPASLIPKNNGSINFGYYLAEPTYEGVQNLQETEKINLSEIRYDYSYTDWDGYPHTVIEYMTAGTSYDHADSHAAITLSGANIYGHVMTTVPNHVASRGGDVLFGVHLYVNDDQDKDLEFRFAAVDSQGNINWNPQRENLANGSYEFYMFSTKCWGSSPNMASLNEHDVCFGRAWVTVSDDSTEMEWVVDAKTLADYYDLNEDELYVLSNRYMRIGSEVSTTAGVSTGGIPGACVCVLIALALAGLYKRRKQL